MFLDTSGLLFFYDPNAPQHQLARDLVLEARTHVIHNYVLAEFTALAESRRFPRRPMLDFVARLEEGSEVAVVWVDRDRHVAARRLLQRQLDKTYSLCDAVSFMLMRELGETDALTTDHHFEQAGFRCLLHS